MKGTVGGVTTVYIAGLYEYSGSAGKSYYTGPGGVVAMRSGGTVYYLLSDHLNSTARIVNSAGTTQSTRYYYPYGGNRGAAFSTLTTRRFTGQYHESSIPGGEGLSYYNARWYDAKLGRFISADTIVPNPSNPQAFNRYAYVYNNPLRYNDPSGHCPVCIVLGIAAFLLAGSEAPTPAGSYTRSPGANLPPYRQGAVEVRQNRAAIESLASDQVPGILLAASIANQGNTYQRPFGWDGGEFFQVFVDPDPSVGIGQMRPGEARGLGYEGWTVGLLDDETSIKLMAAKLQNTVSALSEFNLDPTESFMLLAIGNNIGDTVAGRFRGLPDENRNVQTLLRNDPEARTQFLKMMNWMEYLHANDGWTFPAGVDTGRVWQMLQNAYRQ